MSDFVILSDAGCDLVKELRERFCVADYLKGVLYLPNGEETRSDLDWSFITPTEYFNSMKSKNVIYKTAAPTLGDTQELFEKYLQDGKDILSISMSSALSCTYQNCLNTAKNLEKKYPSRKIICVDSLRYSTSLALILALAGEKKKSGATIEETAEFVESVKHKVHQMGPMDDLFFLCKTGRISNFKAFFGSLVGVNPLADFNRNGLSEVLAKAKGKKSALNVTLKYIEKTIVNPEEQIIFIAHSNRKEIAKVLAEQIKEKFNPKEVIINNVGMSCGANIGPGLCAAFYLGEEISENNIKEKAIITEIMNAK